MQCFSFSKSLMHNQEVNCVPRRQQVKGQPFHHPLVLDVSPLTVPCDKHAVIIIRGRHFCSAQPINNKSPSLRVLIGNRSVEHRVIDDSTLIAISSPCQLPKYVNQYGIYETSLEDCISCRFNNVVIEIVFEEGIVLRSDSIWDNKIPKIWNLEYEFP